MQEVLDRFSDSQEVVEGSNEEAGDEELDEHLGLNPLRVSSKSVVPGVLHERVAIGRGAHLEDRLVSFFQTSQFSAISIFQDRLQENIGGSNSTM